MCVTSCVVYQSSGFTVGSQDDYRDKMIFKCINVCIILYSCQISLAFTTKITLVCYSSFKCCIRCIRRCNSLQHSGKARLGLFMRNLNTVEVGVMSCKVQQVEHSSKHAHQQKTVKSSFTLKEWDSNSSLESSGLTSLSWGLRLDITLDISVLFCKIWWCHSNYISPSTKKLVLLIVTPLRCLAVTVQNDVCKLDTRRLFFKTIMVQCHLVWVICLWGLWIHVTSHFFWVFQELN